MLLPTAALIAVESASQWEILRRKQAQSLSNHAGLDFEESTQQTPEPSHWVLLGFLFVYLLCHRYRVANKTQKAQQAQQAQQGRTEIGELSHRLCAGENRSNLGIYTKRIP